MLPFLTHPQPTLNPPSTHPQPTLNPSHQPRYLTYKTQLTKVQNGFRRKVALRLVRKLRRSLYEVHHQSINQSIDYSIVLSFSCLVFSCLFLSCLAFSCLLLKFLTAIICLNYAYNHILYHSTLIISFYTTTTINHQDWIFRRRYFYVTRINSVVRMFLKKCWLRNVKHDKILTAVAEIEARRYTHIIVIIRHFYTPYQHLFQSVIIDNYTIWQIIRC